MGSQRNLMLEMNTPHRQERTALDYRESSSYIFKLATNPAWIRTRQRRVQTSPRQFGSLERCWIALPIVPVGARSVKPAGASLLATGFNRPRFDGPVRFGR